MFATKCTDRSFFTRFHRLYSSVITQGDSHGYIIHQGKPYGWGWNQKGQLGFSNFDHLSTTPKKPVGNILPIKDISGGVIHTVAIDEQGMIWTWGGNTFGQLGINKEFSSSVYIPQRVYVQKPMISVSTTGMSNTSLDQDGGVWVWGWNNGGKLGFNHQDNILEPTKHENIPPIQYISSGAAHSMLVDYDGNVWVFGDNKFGQLGLSSTFSSIPIQKHPDLSNITSVACGMGISAALDKEGSVYQINCSKFDFMSAQNNEVKPKDKKFDLVPGLPKIKRIECGAFHFIAVDVDDNLWAWGGNERGQLGFDGRMDRETPEKLNLQDVENFACGADASVFLLKDGTVLFCGKPYFNASGDLDVLTPTKIFNKDDLM